MFGLDSFTLAVLGSAIVVLVVFALMIVMDKGKQPVTPPASVPGRVAGAPAKASGKR